jgi:adenylate cyclase
MGEQQVKNIARPVRVYRVWPDGAAPTVAAGPLPTRGRRARWATAAVVALVVALVVAMAALWRLHRSEPVSPPAATATAMSRGLPDKPSIAVLPFANLTGDLAQDYLGEGLTENILDALAQNPGLFVIARNATLVYRGKAAPPRAVANDLGVRYVLEGSVQKSGDRLRVTAQLIDALNDNHLLSRKYDRKLTDLFALEDDLTLQIAGALDAQLSGTMWSRIAARGTRNLEAWENAIKGGQAFTRFDSANMAEAQKLFQRAVELDPNYTWASTLLAYTYFNQAFLGSAKDRRAALARAREINDKNLRHDPQLAPAYHLRSRLEMLWDLPEFDPDAALADARKGVELGPNDDDQHYSLGYTLFSLGHFEEAAAEFATCMRLNPHPPIWEPGWHATALSATGQHREAIAEVEATIAAHPNNPLGPLFRGAVEAWAGRYAEAIGSFERSGQLDPNSALYAWTLAPVYDRLGRTEDAIRLFEKGPPLWRSVPQIRLWLALSYGLAGRKEQATAEFAAFRALAPKFTAGIEQRMLTGYWGYLGPQFSARLVALSRDYGISEK